MTFVGIRYLITSGIHIRGVIDIRIEGRRIRVVVDMQETIQDGLVVVAGITIRRVMAIGRAAMPIGRDAMAIAIGITRRGVV